MFRTLGSSGGLVGSSGPHHPLQVQAQGSAQDDGGDQNQDRLPSLVSDLSSSAWFWIAKIVLPLQLKPFFFVVWYCRLGFLCSRVPFQHCCLFQGPPFCVLLLSSRRGFQCLRTDSRPKSALGCEVLLCSVLFCSVLPYDVLFYSSLVYPTISSCFMLGWFVL